MPYHTKINWILLFMKLIGVKPDSLITRNWLKLAIQAIGSKPGIVVGRSVVYDAPEAPNEYGTQGYDIKIKDLRQSTYIVGRHGEGKSTLMLNMALQDIDFDDKAIVVLDPHGDLADDIMHRVSPGQASRVIYFAPGVPLQKQNPFGLNPFECTDKEDIHYKFDAIMKVFTHSWSTSFKLASTMQNTLETLARLLLEAYPKHQTTFYHAFLITRRDHIGQSYRKELLDMAVDNPVIRYNLEQWMDDKKFIDDTQSSLHKINHILQHPVILAILSQAKSAECFDFKKLVDRRNVLVVNLRGLDEEGRRLIGSILLTQIVASAKRHGNVNTPCHIYADEFHTFSTESFEEIINQCRKHGLMVTIAHQTLAQLDEKALAASQNCGNVICFRTNPSDAQALVKHFYGLATDVFHTIPRYHALVKTVQEKIAPEPNLVRVLNKKGTPLDEVAKLIVETSQRYGTPLEQVMRNVHELSPKTEFINASPDSLSDAFMYKSIGVTGPNIKDESDKTNEATNESTPKGRRKSRFAKQDND